MADYSLKRDNEIHQGPLFVFENQYEMYLHVFQGKREVLFCKKLERHNIFYEINGIFYVRNSTIWNVYLLSNLFYPFIIYIEFECILLQKRNTVNAYQNVNILTSVCSGNSQRK